MDKSICVVYDNLDPISSLRKYFLDGLPLQLMKQKLLLVDLPLVLQNHCVFQPPCKIFENMLLSVGGNLSHPPLLLDSPQLSICTTCFESFQKVSYNGPPQFTIANRLYMGILFKKHHSLTKTKLAQNSVWLSIVKFK